MNNIELEKQIHSTPIGECVLMSRSNAMHLLRMERERNVFKQCLESMHMQLEEFFKDYPR